ncbi:unnamed protein product [Urochloa decumbens]|uniref:Uncharacterized protein n=1 Tax=Urochloa decumbens TaxID=240449 RepID=A0ABC8YCD7_9POAL
MAPISADGKPSCSASAIIADTARGYHILRIDGYSRTKGKPTGECLKSILFTVGGKRWYISYFPNGKTSEAKEYISVFLYLEEEDETMAQFQFRFADEVAVTPISLGELCSFGVNVKGWGHVKFIKREDLEKSKHLKDDSFTVRCDIAVVSEFHTKEIDEAASPAFVLVPPSDLHQHLGDFLHTERGTDVVFEVGNETFAARRCVLAARSPVFNAELFDTMKESNTAGVVRIDDMEAQVFKALLYFMYTDSLPKTEKEGFEEDVMSQHLLVAADRYNLERLKLICEDKLCKHITVGTVATTLVLAEQHNYQGLKEACIEFLISPDALEAVMETDGFEHLTKSCPALVKELLSKLATSCSCKRRKLST